MFRGLGVVSGFRNIEVFFMGSINNRPGAQRAVPNVMHFEVAYVENHSSYPDNIEELKIEDD